MTGWYLVHEGEEFGVAVLETGTCDLCEGTGGMVLLIETELGSPVNACQECLLQAFQDANGFFAAYPVTSAARDTD